MIFNSYSKRSISTQDSVTEFNWNIALSNTTGAATLGLSGTRSYTFSFRNSKIYDNNNNFIGSYSPNVVFNISGQVSQSSSDYWINGIPVAIESPVSTGKFDWFFIRPSGAQVDFDGEIKGSLPNYSIDSTGYYQYENYKISGRVINNNPSRKFRIFNVNLPSTGYSYTIDSFTTGDITNTGYIVLTSDRIGLTDEIIPLTIDTNFGQIVLDYYITGDGTQIPNIYLNLSPDDTNIFSNQLKYYDIILSAFPSGTRLGISLNYYSGVTGSIYFLDQFTNTGAVSILSGDITGSGSLRTYQTGVVTGLDPKTSINETGLGSGYLTTDIIYATGFVSGQYLVTGYGKGNADFAVDYVASGYGDYIITGYVGVNGEYLEVNGYNFAGTGNNPIISTGNVGTGTGLALVRPTGCLQISSGLISGVDYVPAYLAANKVFEGILSGTYSVLAVGYATGINVQGTVDSYFIKNLEPGTYVFTKQFSGNVTGYAQDTGRFNPVSGCSANSAITGFLYQTINYTGVLDCSSFNGFSSLPVSGIVTGYYENGVPASGTQVANLVPSGGFDLNENLSNLNSRTRISRSGVTSSGTGYFSNVVSECSFVQDFNLEKQWKEFFTGVSGTLTGYDSLQNQIKTYDAKIPISGFGAAAFVPQGLDSSALDSGLLKFTITGGKKTIGIQGINYEGSGKIVEMYLYKDGFPYYNQPVIGRYEYNSDIVNNNFINSNFNYELDSAIVLKDLETGNYGLLIFAIQKADITVSFETSNYTTCETGGYVNIKVISSTADNQTRNKGRAWFEIQCYDNTARSGVSYQPVSISYTNTGNPNIYGGFIDTEADNVYEFSIPIINNPGDQGDYVDFTLYLQNLSGCSYGLYPYTTVTIYNTGTFSCGNFPYIAPPNPLTYRARELNPYTGCGYSGGQIVYSMNCDGRIVTGYIYSGMIGEVTGAISLSQTPTGNYTGAKYLGKLAAPPGVVVEGLTATSTGSPYYIIIRALSDRELGYPNGNLIDVRGGAEFRVPNPYTTGYPSPAVAYWRDGNTGILKSGVSNYQYFRYASGAFKIEPNCDYYHFWATAETRSTGLVSNPVVTGRTYISGNTGVGIFPGIRPICM